jgi:hypothetical protein
MGDRESFQGGATVSEVAEYLKMLAKPTSEISNGGWMWAFLYFIM